MKAEIVFEGKRVANEHRPIRIVKKFRSDADWFVVLERMTSVDALDVKQWHSITPDSNNGLGRYFMEEFIKVRDELERVRDILNQIADPPLDGE